MSATPTTSLSFQNFFSATLSSGISSTDTDIFLDTIPNGSEGFLVIDPDSTTSREVIYYNSKTALKVVCPSVADGRGQDDTTATSHNQGTTVIMAPIAAYFETLLSLFTTSPQGWTSLSGTFTGVVYNGNRSYTVTTSVDQSAIVDPGMRVRTTRGTTAPTQCADLEASSSQYFNDTSLTGMTFTDDFVVSAWVKVESYANMEIASRWNGTSGWGFRINSSGQIMLFGNNAGGVNYSYVQSYQSVPLGKWVHVAAQLDMSTFTATTTTSYVMIDGVDVPASVARGGTNPTALVQAGNLEIGAGNGGANPFDGKIAQVAIYSAKVTQANVRATISQGLSGSETSLVSAYSFNNSINDLSANANNLTAQGSAVATNADSPFTQNASAVPGGTYDYGIVTAVTSSTLTLQVPEGCAIPTQGTVSAMSYSTFKKPFGFPAQRGRWQVETLYKTSQTQGTPTISTYYNIGAAKLTVPVGDFSLGFNVNVQNDSSASAAGTTTALSTSTSSLSDDNFKIFSYTSSTDTGRHFPQTLERQVSVSSATPYYLIMAPFSSTTTTMGFLGTAGPMFITAEPSHL